MASMTIRIGECTFHDMTIGFNFLVGAFPIGFGLHYVGVPFKSIAI